MPMTDIPEIGAENRYRLTCNLLQNFQVAYRFLVTNRTMLYFRAGLWFRFSAPISERVSLALCLR